MEHRTAIMYEVETGIVVPSEQHETSSSQKSENSNNKKIFNLLFWLTYGIIIGVVCQLSSVLMGCYAVKYSFSHEQYVISCVAVYTVAMLSLFLITPSPSRYSDNSDEEEEEKSDMETPLLTNNDNDNDEGQQKNHNTIRNWKNIYFIGILVSSFVHELFLTCVIIPF